MDLKGGSAHQHAPGSFFGRWWAEEVTAGVDHRAVVERVREDAGWSSHFAFMTLMSAGIAVLGLLLSSPAVVIGAMLISPLMGPIIGMGFGLATFDSAEIRRTLFALATGILVAVLFCAAIVLVSPLQTVTSEISARTRPNLFDLLVALFAGIAGTYAMIRGRHGAIVGVAIATALMPPVAVVGYGLATWNGPVLAGSALLLFTNLMTIAAAAAVLARLYGFAPDLSPHQTRLQAALIVVVLVALAVPLGLSLKQIAWEALVGREATSAIAAAFPADARVNDFQIDYHADPIEVAATVITPTYRRDAERALRDQLADLVGRPVALSLDQVRTVDGDAPFASTQPSGTSLAEKSASRVAERLSLVAGVPPDHVVVDRVAKRAEVRAMPLPGADLAAYRELETRVAASESGWEVRLVPPLAPLPDVALKDGVPDAASLATATWAAQRLHLPVTVSGGERKRRGAVVQQLRDVGIDAREGTDGDRNAISLRWVTPEQQPASR